MEFGSKVLGERREMRIPKPSSHDGGDGLYAVLKKSARCYNFNAEIPYD